jgi:MFS family permease
VINAAVMTLAPLYAVHFYGEGSEKGFQAAAWIGSLILQYPAGRWSDRVDRRIVIAALTGLAAASAGALAFFGGTLAFHWAALLFALWGAGALSFYGIAVAHMADRAEPGALARSTSGLLFVWAVGSVIGPLMAGACVDLWGEQALFWFAAVTCAVLTFAMIVRTGLRAAVVNRGKEIFAPKQATSVAAAEMAYGEGDKGK